MSPYKLVLGPLFFNWSSTKRLNFYTDIAENSCFDIVHLGDVVCAKRHPQLLLEWAKIATLLTNAGKEVVFSLQGLYLSSSEVEKARKFIEENDYLYEINDFASLSLIPKPEFTIGPLANIYNEAAVKFFVEKGSQRFCFPIELPRDIISTITNTFPQIEFEAFIYGRVPLAISARCYHARAHNIPKSNCTFICDTESDGMLVDTMDHQPFLCINGTQTLSYSIINLAKEIEFLKQHSVTHFRLSPHNIDMVELSYLYRDLINGKVSAEYVLEITDGLIDGSENCNGFIHNTVGKNLV